MSPNLFALLMTAGVFVTAYAVYTIVSFLHDVIKYWEDK